MQCAAQFVRVLHFMHICILHPTQDAHCKNNKSRMVVRYSKHSLSEVHSAFTDSPLKACMNMNLHRMKSHIEKLYIWALLNCVLIGLFHLMDLSSLKCHIQPPSTNKQTHQKRVREKKEKGNISSSNTSECPCQMMWHWEVNLSEVN